MQAFLIMQLGEIIILHKNSVWQIYRAVKNIYIINGESTKQTTT